MTRSFYFAAQINKKLTDKKAFYKKLKNRFNYAYCIN